MSQKRKARTLDTFLVKRNKDEETSNLEPTNSEAINMTLKKNEDQIGVSDIPEIWTAEMWEEKRKIYPWLVCERGKLGCSICSKVGSLGVEKTRGLNISIEWSSSLVGFHGKTRSVHLASLRKKCHRHANSQAHIKASNIKKTANDDTLGKMIDQLNESEINLTCKIFRTAYFIAKNSKPFSDHFELLELQELNGAYIPHGLRSRFSATNICDHIAVEMKQRICTEILKVNGKISVLIDESTTLSKKSTLIVYLKCQSIRFEEPHFIFLDLVELRMGTAEAITEVLLSCLLKYGFDDAYLKQNLISFTSDGASVMLGKKSGVAQRLMVKYPNIIVWHCLNHRLELSVGDVVSEVVGVNYFRGFMDKLYALYSQSPKNMAELEEHAKDVGKQVLRIGRVLNTRWVASSFRTVSSVWKNYDHLCKHFETSSEDLTRLETEKAVFRGLWKRISSKQFLIDLALMYDVLYELSLLSEGLQKRNVTLLYADSLIRRCIKHLENMKQHKGEKVIEAEEAIKKMVFNSVKLADSKKIKSISHEQFLTSLINRMEARLIPEAVEENGKNAAANQSVIADICVLDPNKWPEEIPPNFGRNEIKSLCHRFHMTQDLNATVIAFEDYIDNGGKKSVPVDLQPLLNCIKVIPCSSAECERGFSVMNCILTDIRSRLLVNRVSNLMFIKLHGPPVNLWKPDEYVLKWLRNHRSAIDSQTKIAKTNSNQEEDPIWKFL